MHGGRARRAGRRRGRPLRGGRARPHPRRATPDPRGDAAARGPRGGGRPPDRPHDPHRRGRRLRPRERSCSPSPWWAALGRGGAPGHGGARSGRSRARRARCPDRRGARAGWVLGAAPGRASVAAPTGAWCCGTCGGCGRASSSRIGTRTAPGWTRCSTIRSAPCVVASTPASSPSPTPTSRGRAPGRGPGRTLRTSPRYPLIPRCPAGGSGRANRHGTTTGIGSAENPATVAGAVMGTRGGTRNGRRAGERTGTDRGRSRRRGGPDRARPWRGCGLSAPFLLIILSDEFGRGVSWAPVCGGDPGRAVRPRDRERHVLVGGCDAERC